MKRIVFIFLLIIISKYSMGQIFSADSIYQFKDQIEIIDINKQDERGWTHLMTASYEGQKETVRLFLYKEADMEIASNEGFTALILASFAGHTEIVNLLLEKGSDINVQENNGFTPFLVAAQA